MLLIPNPKLEEELLGEREFVEALKQSAAPLASSVRSAMPVGSTGRAKESVKVVSGGRASVAVAITDPFGHLIEWGSIKNPAYAPLRRGARNAGFRLAER